MIHALLRNDEPYRDSGVDYERLLVERNAPRWMRKLEEKRLPRGAALAS